MTTTPMSAIERKRLASDELRHQITALSGEVTVYREQIDGIDAQLTANDARRAAELAKAEPSAMVLGQCDRTKQKLLLEKEAASAATRHASKRVEDARAELTRGEEALRGMYQQVAHLRDAIPAQRAWIRDVEYRRVQAERNAAALTTREREARQRLADLERALTDLAGDAREPATRVEYPREPKPSYTTQ